MADLNSIIKLQLPIVSTTTPTLFLLQDKTELYQIPSLDSFNSSPILIYKPFMSKLNYSTTTRDDNQMSRTRGPAPTHQPSVSQNNLATGYQRLPMYTFSPNDRRNQNEYSSVSRGGGRNQRSQTLVESEVRSPRQMVSDNMQPRYSMTAGTRSAMISKLREMGQGIDQLMQRSSSASQELTSSLLHLKDLIEDVFCQVTAELEDLKAENYELRAEGSGVESDRVKRLEDHYQYKIMDLEAQKDQLQASLRRLQGAFERGETAREELAKKARQTQQISKELSKLEDQRDANRATINRLNAKIGDLAAEKDEFKKRVNAQDEYLNQIKSEAKNAIGTNRNLQRRLDEAEGQIGKLQRQVELLDRKNRELEEKASRLEAEREKILKQSKVDIAQLSDVRDQNKNLTRQLQSIMSKLKDQSQQENELKSQLDLYKRELETERRKTGEMKQSSRRQQQDYQNSLNAEREKLSRRLQDEQNKYKDAEKRFADQLRKSDLIESELEKYRKELENERRRSNMLENEYQTRSKQFQEERDGLLGKLDEQKRNFKKQVGQLNEYAQKLGKSEDLLKEFARQSDLQERELRDMRKEMQDERRRSSLAQQQAVKKLKQLAVENQNLHRLSGQNQEKHQKVLDAMRDYENRYKDAQRRYAEETRKSEVNEKKIREILAELDETRRLSQLDIRDKADLIRKIENKNDQLQGQIKEEQDAFKKKQAEFFNKNKELEKVLQENARKSDMMAQQLLQLKDQYEKQRRKSLTYEQEQKQLNSKMRDLGQKYSHVAQQLEQSRDIYKNKEDLYNALERKHKQIQKLLLEQTRKSQLDEEQLKMLHDEIEGERRKSAAFEQESINKIKDLLGKNDVLANNLRQQQAKHDKAAELMRRAEQRARELQRQGEEWRRKSDMFAAESGRYRDELQKERRRSMAMEAEHENRVKTMEKKNIQLMQKLDEDRDRLGKSSEALRQAEIKYAKIQQILDDQRRASQMSQAQLKKLADDFENERRKSTAFEEQAKRKFEELARRNRQIQHQAEELQERLSISNKTVRSLQTKASNAERSVDQLSRMLDDVNQQKQKSDQLARRYKEEIGAKEAAIRKEREERQNVLQGLKAIENRMRETDNQIRQMTQAHQSLLREIDEKEKQLAESSNNNEYLAATLNDLRVNEKKLNERVEELYRVNIENAATFEKNYQTLKSEINHRDKANQQKEKRIQKLQKQVIQDSKRVVAINPTKIIQQAKDAQNSHEYNRKV